MSVDRRSEAEQYRALMFQLAGEGDPSTRMAQTPDKVRGIVESESDQFRSRPALGEWSVIELLGHMVDVEHVAGVRLRRTLYEADVTLPGFDQDRWVSARGCAEVNPGPLLDALTAMRPLTIAAWENASAEQRQDVALHADRGPESAEKTYRMLAGHDQFHLDQMRRTLEQVRGAAR